MDTAYGPFRLRLFWRVLLRLLLGPGQLSALCNCMASAQVQRRQRCWRAARPAGPSCWARPLAKGMLRCLGHAKRNLRAVRRRLCTDIVCPLCPERTPGGVPYCSGDRPRRTRTTPNCPDRRPRRESRDRTLSPTVYNSGARGKRLVGCGLRLAAGQAQYKLRSTTLVEMWVTTYTYTAYVVSSVG